MAYCNECKAEQCCTIDNLCHNHTYRKLTAEVKRLAQKELHTKWLDMKGGGK